ncbi:MAG: hypothetical protein ACI4NA_05910 [Succinivibrio sp.]
MISLSALEKIDPELYSYFEKEMEHQHSSLSFIPDENATSPLCASIMGNVLVNSAGRISYARSEDLEKLTLKRICELFGAPCANIRTLNIEAASRVVFQALTKRGDVVLSLDLRKKEHCNSENLVFRFVNYGISTKTKQLDYDDIERKVKENRPHMVILSPVNYPFDIDYQRLSEICRAAGALLWVDISQTSGLIAAGVLQSPVPYSDIVTFTMQGAMQGPQCAVILSKSEHGGAIGRAVNTSGHRGLLTAQLAALSARIHEMATPCYREYCKTVLENAVALEKGLSEGGMKLIGPKTQSHFVMVDMKDTALSARGAQEMLADCGVMVRSAQVMTSDPEVKYDSVRLSVLSATTRGVKASDLERAGKAIGRYLLSPDEERTKELSSTIASITGTLPFFSKKWVPEGVEIGQTFSTEQLPSSTD